MGRVIKAAERLHPVKPVGPEARQAAAELLAAQLAVQTLTARAREQVVALSLAMTEQIVGRAVALDPALLDGIYSQCLESVPALGPATLLVHPADRTRSRVEALAAAAGVAIEDDPTVGRAGCRLRAAGATIDATLETALTTLAAALQPGKDHA